MSPITMIDDDGREKDTFVQEIENPPKPSKRSRIVSHLKKFWWVHVLIILCAIVLGVTLTIFVGVKSIAQKKLNQVTLTVQDIKVMGTQSTNFTMSINSTIVGKGGIKATIAPFDGDMYLEDEPSHIPFATIRFPETHNVKVQTVNVSQLIPIKNMGALTTFNSWLLDNDTVRVTVNGNTKVHVPGISRGFPIHFKKTITIPGMRMFNGTTTTNNTIKIAGFGDGSNFHAVVTIPNRSIVTFEIGNASFANYLLGQEVGTTYIDNIVLKPGDNVLPMRANISTLPVLAAISKQPYCQSGDLPFVLNGRSVTNNGQDLTYFSDALKTGNTTVDIDIGTALKNLGVSINCSS